MKAIVVVPMLGIAALVLGACGAGHNATTAQKAAQDQQAAQAQKAAQVQTLDATVVGMHYVQMAKAVDPLAARLRAEVATGKAVPSTQVKATTSAVEQFDTAAASLAAPGNLQVTLHTLLAADGHLVKDLAVVKGNLSRDADAEGRHTHRSRSTAVGRFFLVRGVGNVDLDSLKHRRDRAGRSRGRQFEAVTGPRTAGRATEGRCVDSRSVRRHTMGAVGGVAGIAILQGQSWTWKGPYGW